MASPLGKVIKEILRPRKHPALLLLLSSVPLSFSLACVCTAVFFCFFNGEEACGDACACRRSRRLRYENRILLVPPSQLYVHPSDRLLAYGSICPWTALRISLSLFLAHGLRKLLTLSTHPTQACLVSHVETLLSLEEYRRMKWPCTSVQGKLTVLSIRGVLFLTTLESLRILSAVETVQGSCGFVSSSSLPLLSVQALSAASWVSSEPEGKEAADTRVWCGWHFADLVLILPASREDAWPIWYPTLLLSSRGNIRWLLSSSSLPSALLPSECGLRVLRRLRGSEMRVSVGLQAADRDRHGLHTPHQPPPPISLSTAPRRQVQGPRRGGGSYRSIRPPVCTRRRVSRKKKLLMNAPSRRAGMQRREGVENRGGREADGEDPVRGG